MGMVMRKHIFYFQKYMERNIIILRLKKQYFVVTDGKYIFIKYFFEKIVFIELSTKNIICYSNRGLVKKV